MPLSDTGKQTTLTIPWQQLSLRESVLRKGHSSLRLKWPETARNNVQPHKAGKEKIVFSDGTTIVSVCLYPPPPKKNPGCRLDSCATPMHTISSDCTYSQIAPPHPDCVLAFVVIPSAL